MSEPVAGEVGRPELAPGAAMPHAIPGDQLRNHVDPDIATPGQLGLLHPVEVAAAGVEQRPDLELLETSVAPFLLDMARDLGAELAAVGNLVGLLSAAWGVMSLMAGSASDRLGRRPILVGGVLALAVARGGLALAGSYGTAAAWQFAAGLGGGAFMGTVFTAVSDRVPAAARGRALGWVLTGQSLSVVLTPLEQDVAAGPRTRG